MDNLTRRGAIGMLGVGAGLAFVPTGPARADGRMAMRAIRQFALGDMQITVIDDGSFSMGVGMFGANAPDGAVGDLLASYGMDRQMAEMPLQIMLVETEGLRVLIDTGMGDTTFHGNDVDNGRLVRSLETLGLRPTDIDIVLLTHGHPDHVGGLTVEGEQLFSASTHFIPEVEFGFWTQDPNSAPRGLREMIIECRNHLLPIAHGMRSFADGDEIAPGVFAVAAHGHTHGHFAIRLESRGEQLLHLVDVAVHYIAGLEHPEWTVGADLNKPLAVETRRRLLSQAADEQVLVAGYHFPFPGVGRIMRMGEGFRYVPMPLV